MLHVSPRIFATVTPLILLARLCSAQSVTGGGTIQGTVKDPRMVQKSNRAENTRSLRSLCRHCLDC
jgi:hypothetical protein